MEIRKPQSASFAAGQEMRRMTLTLDIPEELAGRLKRAAAAQGVDLDEYLRPVLEAAAPTPLSEAERAARLAAIDAGAGSMAHLPGSLDEFLREKHEQTLHEEERDRRRLPAAEQEVAEGRAR
jgi:hypothetical protein